MRQILIAVGIALTLSILLTPALIKIFDPNNVMNPGKVGF